MTLTRRLSIFFLSSLAVVLVGFSISLYFLADTHLNHQLDDRLQAATHTLSSAVEVDPDGLEWEPTNRVIRLGPSGFGDQVCWEVSTQDGRQIDHSAQPGTESLMTEAKQALAAGHRNPRTLLHDGKSWRITQARFTSEVTPSGLDARKHAELVLTVVVPHDPVRETLRELAIALVSLTLLVLLVALVGVRFVCSRAISPVIRMADSARAMGSTDLSERLPVAASADELADLGRAFNGLLDRLAESFERERRFAGEASHQLRTPLAALIGQAEVALRRERPAEDYRRGLESVLAQAGRLRRVVEALLFLARCEADAQLPGVERIDLNHLTTERLRSWTEHSRAADLDAQLCNEPAWVAVHPDLFGELLDALLDNAGKYSAPGTPITIRTAVVGNEVHLDVADQGCGIAADDLPHLFRPFFRTETARLMGQPGAGLGLAVAFRIATALGAKIEVRSEPGRGSIFTIRLDLQPPSIRL